VGWAVSSDRRPGSRVSQGVSGQTSRICGACSDMTFLKTVQLIMFGSHQSMFYSCHGGLQGVLEVSFRTIQVTGVIAAWANAKERLRLLWRHQHGCAVDSQ
jgi:hypothetical protein